MALMQTHSVSGLVLSLCHMAGCGDPKYRREGPQQLQSLHPLRGCVDFPAAFPGWMSAFTGPWRPAALSEPLQGPGTPCNPSPTSQHGSLGDPRGCTEVWSGWWDVPDSLPFNLCQVS